MAREALKNVLRLIEQTKEELPIEQAFIEDLKRSIELDDRKNARKPSPTYKPSSMNCIRNMYYQVTDTEQDEGYTPYALIGICNSGTDMHERIQKSVASMKDNGIDCEYINVGEFVRSRGLDDKIEIVSQQGMETKLYHKDLNMSFLCDGIIRYCGQYYILELKTEASFKFMNRKGVDPSHYNQGTAYSIAFGLDKVIFVYISRDTTDMRSYMFEPTSDMKQDLIGKIDECNRYVMLGQVPPKPDPLVKKVCQYCSYLHRCKIDN